MGHRRTIFAIAGSFEWPIYYLDVKTAFLNGAILRMLILYNHLGSLSPARNITYAIYNIKPSMGCAKLQELGNTALTTTSKTPIGSRVCLIKICKLFKKVLSLLCSCFTSMICILLAITKFAFSTVKSILWLPTK
jgi:hypothetical protein